MRYNTVQSASSNYYIYSFSTHLSANFIFHQYTEHLIIIKCPNSTIHMVFHCFLIYAFQACDHFFNFSISQVTDIFADKPKEIQRCIFVMPMELFWIVFNFYLARCCLWLSDQLHLSISLLSTCLRFPYPKPSFCSEVKLIANILVTSCPQHTWNSSKSFFLKMSISVFISYKVWCFYHLLYRHPYHFSIEKTP